MHLRFAWISECKKSQGGRPLKAIGGQRGKRTAGTCLLFPSSVCRHWKLQAKRLTHEIEGQIEFIRVGCYSVAEGSFLRGKKAFARTREKEPAITV